MKRLASISKFGFLILMSSLLVASYSPAVLAGGPGTGNGDQQHDHDQIRGRDRLHDGALVLLGDNDQDRLRTRDRLRDCDLNPWNMRPTFSAGLDQFRFQIQNRYRYFGILSPESLIIPGWHPVRGPF